MKTYVHCSECSISECSKTWCAGYLFLVYKYERYILVTGQQSYLQLNIKFWELICNIFNFKKKKYFKVCFSRYYQATESWGAVPWKPNFQNKKYFKVYISRYCQATESWGAVPWNPNLKNKKYFKVCMSRYCQATESWGLCHGTPIFHNNCG